MNPCVYVQKANVSVAVVWRLRLFHLSLLEMSTTHLAHTTVCLLAFQFGRYGADLAFTPMINSKSFIHNPK